MTVFNLASCVAIAFVSFAIPASVAFADPTTTPVAGSANTSAYATTLSTRVWTRGGAASNQGTESAKSSDSSQASNGKDEDPCWYTPVRARKGDPRLGNDDPSTGVLYEVSCPDAINAGTGNVVFANLGAVWAPNGVPPAAPPPDPAQLAQEAAGQMTAPDPVLHLGPDPARLAVKIPVWLSVDNPGPMTLTVAVRGLSVTVTATLASTTWTMGEPTTTTTTLTCTGAGTPPPPNPDPSTTPPCGYTYHWKSTTDRTHGTGTWPVTATTHWQVTWTATNGTNGALPAPLTPTSTQQFPIGEWRSTLIADPDH